MTAGQHIDYDAMALEALRGVVKACLTQVAGTGLLGDHHFYIAFNTQAPGVGMSKRLKEKYPVEMTIVLQHRFWDLAVEDDRFEVKLTFDGIPERLIVPFKAIKVFYDPSVPYGLQFEEAETSAAPDAARRSTRRAVGIAKDGDPRDGRGPHEAVPADTGVDGRESDTDEGAPERGDRRRPLRRPKAEPRAGEPRPVVAQPSPVRRSMPAERSATGPGEAAQPAAPMPAQPKPAVVASVGKGEEAGSKSSPTDDAKSGNGAKIFDLSQFRKK